MKTTTVVGMKREVCANCFEYPENCRGCEFNECAICQEELTDSETYEYRGVFSCAEHFKELQEKRDYQRKQVMEVVDHSVRSQADGEWQNGGYKTMKVGHDGRPVTTIKEPMSLKDYEEGKL